jgi:hypothetical protein
VPDSGGRLVHQVKIALADMVHPVIQALVMSEPHPLENYLDRSKKSARAFAREVGCSHVTISGICQGTRLPSVAMIKRMCAASDGALTPSDFFVDPHEATPCTE